MGLSPLTGLCGLVCVGCPLPACPQMPTEVGMSRDCLHPSSLPSGFGWSLVGAGRRGALGSLIPACAATQAFPEVLTALRSRYRRPEKNGARAMDREASPRLLAAVLAPSPHSFTHSRWFLDGRSCGDPGSPRAEGLGFKACVCVGSSVTPAICPELPASFHRGGGVGPSRGMGEPGQTPSLTPYWLL